MSYFQVDYLTTPVLIPCWTLPIPRMTWPGRAPPRVESVSPTSATTPVSPPVTHNSTHSRSRRTASAPTTSPSRPSPARTTPCMPLSTRSSSQDTLIRMVKTILARFLSIFITTIIITITQVPAGGRFSRGMLRIVIGCTDASTATVTTEDTTAAEEEAVRESQVSLLTTMM